MASPSRGIQNRRKIMSVDREDPKEAREAGEHLKRIQQKLDEQDKQFEHLDEDLREAEKKSKAVIRDPEP
jgi:hypothetical protein